MRVRRTPVLGLSEGQRYTIGLGAALAGLLLWSGSPAWRAPDPEPVAVRTPNPPAATPGLAPVASAPEPQAVDDWAPVELPRVFDVSPRGDGPAPGGAPAPAPSASPSAHPLSPGTAVLFARSDAEPPPVAVAVDAAGEVLMARGPHAEITRFDGHGRALDMVRVPRVSGSAGGLVGMSPAPDGGVLVAHADTGEIVSVGAAGDVRTLATLPDLAPCPVIVLVAPTDCEPAGHDAPPRPSGLAVDDGGAVFVSDGGQGVIWRVDAGRPPVLWYGDFRFLSADARGLGGLALDAQGDVLLAQAEGPLGEAQTGVWRIARTADGRAGEAALIVTAQPGERPADVVSGASGSLYVALEGADCVAVFGLDGIQRARYPAAGAQLTAPRALAFAGNTLLVTTTAGDGQPAGLVRLEAGEALGGRQ